MTIFKGSIPKDQAKINAQRIAGRTSKQTSTRASNTQMPYGRSPKTRKR